MTRPQTNAGGSWGYDSEESGGDTVPTLDSLNRFLSATDLSNLWQNFSTNQYHLNYEGTTHTGYHFGTLFNFDTALQDGMAPGPAWPSTSRTRSSKVTRTPGRSLRRSSTMRTTHRCPSTGTIYWQLNKGWPSLLWTLYNNDGDQAGSYFGAQEANTPLHALYALDNGTVTWTTSAPPPSAACRSSRRSTT